jgi:transcriptional regulator with PAS, ATPase and Fis domain
VGEKMFSNDSYTKQFTDMMSEGFIFIDNTGTIQIYNSKAKEIFGINYEYDYSHGSGKIENGDIVIIGDSYLGKDDGGLTPESLKVIGIKDDRIKNGDAVIAVGTYNDCKHNNCKYVFSDNNNSAEKLELDCIYKGVRIYGCIDFINRRVIIQIESERYVLDYIKCIGHIVILDAVSTKMKFYQTKGYTARDEDINNLLLGKAFRAKGENSEFFDVIGKDIFEIHKGNSTIQEFYNAAIGNDIIYTNEYKEINGRPTICSLFPVNKEGKRVGAVLKIKDISEIKRVIKERDEALQNLFRIERKLIDEENSKKLLPELIGESSEMMHVKNLAVKASKSKSTVLILGESGTGKSLLAKVIHDNSDKKNKPFIAVNCSAIPDSLLESELFGYEEGSFTGARIGGKKGLLETAQGGTVFLDEIAEISPSLQGKLLQVLQDKTFYKVGGNNLIKLNVRIIAATNKNLEEEILKNRFREDLYYRINVFPIWIPPLRDRKQDMYVLVKDLLPAICNRLGCEEKGISGEALRLLSSYNYPGNVRELENILERAVNLTEGKIIFSKNLSIDRKSDLVKTEHHKTELLKEILESAEKEAIKSSVSINRGDKQAAMKELGISKTSFYEKIKKYNIDL